MNTKKEFFSINKVLNVVAVMIATICLGAAMIFAVQTEGGGGNSPQIVIDNKNIVLDDNTGKPFINNGVTLVPIRVISENLGYKVDWDVKTKKITITNKTTTVVLTVGSKTSTINGVAKSLLEAPLVKNNRTYVPLRFVGEAFGCDVVWQSPNVYISTEGNVTIPTKATKPITEVINSNNILDLLLKTKGDSNGNIMVTETTLKEGISLSTPVVKGSGDAFTITDMFWSSDRKVFLTAFAKGNTTNSRSFDVQVIKGGKIVGTCISSSVKTGSQGQLVFSIVPIGEDTLENLKNADSLLFIGGVGEAVLIPNPVNELAIKNAWEY